MIFIRTIFLILCFAFTNISLYANEMRIVSLAPNLTEIVYALGLGKNLVGDTVQCDYPEQAKKLYKVGDYINPNSERILFVRPNFVLATMGNSRAVLNKLKLQGINVLEIPDPNNLSELPISIEKIANELGVTAKGQELSKKISAAIKELDYHQVTNKKYLLVLQYNPIYSTSNATWLGHILTRAGYSNVVGASRMSYPVIATEYLIKNKPDIVFTNADNQFSFNENKQIQLVELEKIFGEKEAQKIHIVFLPKDILVRAGPRIVDGIHFLEGLPH